MCLRALDGRRGRLVADPVTADWCDHLLREPIGPEDQALFVRVHLSRAAGAGPSPELSAMMLDLKRAYMELRPRLRRVYTLFYSHTPMWTFLNRVGFRPVPGADEMPGWPRASIDGARLWARLGGRLAGANWWPTSLSVTDAVHLDRAGRELVVDDRRMPLTPLEFTVLQYLMDREGQAVSRTALLDDVWHDTYQGGSNVVDVVVRSLRKKLGRRASAIETVSRLGYRYRSPLLHPTRPRSSFPHRSLIGRARQPHAALMTSRVVLSILGAFSHTYPKEHCMIDNQRLHDLVGRAINDFGATYHSALVVLGDRLGLYRALARQRRA